MDELDDAIRQTLLATIPCAVIVADADMRIVHWNASARELTGYAAEEMIGATCEVLQAKLAATQEPEVIEAICPFQPGGDAEDKEYEILHKSGRVVPVLRRVRAIGDDSGQPAAFVQVLVDLSYVKAARREIRHLREDLARAGRFGQLVGGSPAMVKLYEAIDLVAATDAGVVVQGPTGTGKELVARSIHSRSRRKDGVFLPVNCGALPEGLLEAELFGHVKGAFTGAVADRAGRFEEASGGTLFLDEIAEMPLSAQVKLLRVLQEGEVTRVGESVPRPVDVRIIAATNKDLAAEVAAKRFRQDLYYRLRVVTLSVPALRDRREDIPSLVAHFVDRYNAKYGRAVSGLTAEAMDLLTAHDFPGNVRELEYALEHAFAVTPPSESSLPARSLPPEIAPPTAEPRELPAAGEKDERTEILVALERAQGNKAKTARILGITRAGLYKKLRRLGL